MFIENLHLGSLASSGKNWNILLLANRWVYNLRGLQQVWMMEAYNQHYMIFIRTVC